MASIGDTPTTSSSDQSLNDDESDNKSQNCCKINDDGSMGQAGSIKNKPATKPCKISIEDRDSYAGNKNVAEGLMDIALLSANANQLRFLITYNHDASTYYISMTLVAVSLILQITVGIAMIFKRRFRRCRNKRYNEFILGGVFLITVVNILLAAFTTTTDAK